MDELRLEIETNYVKKSPAALTTGLLS